jgi:glycerophosphoryl diester phosphodiesterase
MFNQTPQNILVAGHRGYAAKYPENTLFSFEKGLEIGVDMFEFDLNLTKDKELVVIHDQTVDRTTNGNGWVRDFTLEQIKTLDAGFHSDYPRQEIPTLRELLTYLRPYKHLLYNVEIKEKTHETVDKAIAMLKEFDILEQCVIACFDAEIVEYAHRTYGVKTQGFCGQLMQNFSDETYSHLYGVGLGMNLLTAELCNEFKQMGIDPWAYCPDTDAEVYEVIRSGATLVTCNDPEPALRILKQEGLHA